MIKKILSLGLTTSVFLLTSCSSTNANKVTEEEVQEIIKNEKSAEQIDDAVEALDSAVKELGDIDELLK